MTPLKIKLPGPHRLEPHGQTVSLMLKQLFLPMDYIERKRSREEIKPVLPHLSTPYFFRLIFSALTNLFQGDDGINRSYDAFGSFKLHHFLREQLKVNHRLFEIQKKILRINSHSYIRLSDANKEKLKLYEEIEPLSWCSSFLMFDLIVEIVIILEEMQIISESGFEGIQIGLLANPSLFIRTLAPLLCAAQSIALEQRGAFSLNAVDRTIAEALGYLGCLGERNVLISQVRSTLFDKGYLEFPREVSLERVDDDVFSIRKTSP
jgi:hypothetical protein